MWLSPLLKLLLVMSFGQYYNLSHYVLDGSFYNSVLQNLCRALNQFFLAYLKRGTLKLATLGIVIICSFFVDLIDVALQYLCMFLPVFYPCLRGDLTTIGVVIVYWLCSILCYKSSGFRWLLIQFSSFCRFDLWNVYRICICSNQVFYAYLKYGSIFTI